MIITVGREHGSNGHEIARRLAEQMGYPCYDKEVVDHAADISAFSRDMLALCDEKCVRPYTMTTLYYVGGIHNGFRLNSQITAAQFEAIRRLADKGNAVFVGRCADYLLKDRKDVVRVFIKADAALRTRNLMERKNISEEQARALMKEVDKDRRSFYKYYTESTWGASENYDLCIDSGRVGIECAVNIIKAYVDGVRP